MFDKQANARLVSFHFGFDSFPFPLPLTFTWRLLFVFLNPLLNRVFKMSAPKKFLIVVALDESISMKAFASRYVELFNDFVDGQKTKCETDAFLTLVRFGKTAKVIKNWQQAMI